MAKLRFVTAMLVLLFVVGGRVAEASDMALPGLSRSSDRYQLELTHKFPAGATEAARSATSRKAQAAVDTKNWPLAIEALEARMGMGNTNETQWRNLATAYLRRTPPDMNKAAMAAFQAWSHTHGLSEGVASLLVLAEALRGQELRAQEYEVLSKAAEIEPGNALVTRQMADSIQAAGMLLSKTQIEPNADQPRVCLSFTTPPSRRADFVPSDWVRIDPPVADAAVTQEGNKLCISGLPSGRTSTVVLRAGMPGGDGISMRHELSIPVAIANREQNIGFDTRLFVLPRGQAPALTLSTVNLSSVSISLMRLSERNVAALLRRIRLGDPLEQWVTESLADDNGSIVWNGHADITGYALNKTTRTAIPLPDVLSDGKPGIYAMTVTPGPDYPPGNLGAIQLILRTNLAPSVWRGSDGLLVQVRDYSNALVRKDVLVRLLARNNDILAEARTDAEGVVRFGLPLLKGEGALAPAAIHVFAKTETGEDFAALDLNAAAFDLSDRGVEGRAQPGPLDSYLWTDRGIYRPGETVHLMALMRDNAGAPADIPAQLTIRRPNGQVFLQTVPPRGADASISIPVVLSSTAPAGVWTAELRADPAGDPIGTQSFRVDAFVPERMAVDVGPLPAALVPGTSSGLPVTARFLYGAPASGLSGKASLRLVIDPAPFPALAGYRIGMEGEAFAPDAMNIDIPETDGQGQTTVPILLNSAPDTTQALKAELDIAINEPSGRASHAAASIPVRPATPLIGIKPGFADRAVDAGTEATFQIAAVSPTGAPIAMQARLRLVRETPDWHVVRRGNLARYETVWRDEPLETKNVTLAADAPLAFARKLPFGRYRLEVSQINGLAVTSLRFRSGWVGSNSPDVPDRVDVSVDRQVIPAGETARVHIAAPFAGHATVLVLTDRVQSLRTLDVPAGGTDIDVPVSADWGPGAYVTVHVFRGNDTAGARPARAIGLTWIGVDPAARALKIAIEAPSQILPRQHQDVVLRGIPGAWVSLAAVDEGILRLTHFISPDPSADFLGRRRLGVDLRDDWGRLIAPAEGDSTLLRQGGDDGGFALPDIPQRTVSLFIPPVQIGPDGRAVVSLDIPDFAGAVRLMAVAWQDRKIGAANTDITVRDPLVAEALLPRFLAPGDEARLAVTLQNVDLPSGEAVANLSVEGPLAIVGPSRLTAVLAPGGRALPATTLRATGTGSGVVKLDITFPGGFHVTRQSTITIRPSRAGQTIVTGAEIAPGATVHLEPAATQFLPGTWRSTASFGGRVRYDVSALTKSLDDYLYTCLEQASSRGMPLAMLPDGPLAGPERAARLQRMVALVLDRQRFDGGFGLWSGNEDPEEWLGSYATDFLLRAQKAGAVVPAQAMRDALRYLATGAQNSATDPEGLADQAYRLYVLAAAGKGLPGAARVLMESLENMPTPLSRAQLGAALALAHDRPRAEAAFAASLAAGGRKWWSLDYGSPVRDQFAITVLLKESGLLPDRLTKLVAQLPGANLDPATLNTQEEAWAVAAAAVLGNDDRAMDLHVDDDPQRAGPDMTLTSAITVHNTGTRPVWQSVATTGVPVQPSVAARAGMRISRKFLNLDGTPLNLDQLHQNTVFVLLLEAKIEDGQAHTAMLQQGLPAGWEIAGSIQGGKDGAVPGMAWLGPVEAGYVQPAADDRFAAVIAADEKHTDIRLAVRLRAVTPGSFALPGATIADMYRPAIFARQAEARIKILPLD